MWNITLTSTFKLIQVCIESKALAKIVSTKEIYVNNEDFYLVFLRFCITVHVIHFIYLLKLILCVFEYNFMYYY